MCTRPAVFALCAPRKEERAQPITSPLPPPAFHSPVLPRAWYPAWATAAFDWYVGTYKDPLVSFLCVLGGDETMPTK